MDDEHIEFTKQFFPKDTIERAKALLESMGGSSGAYSHSKGIPLVRKHVAEFIEGIIIFNYVKFLSIIWKIY